MGGWKNKEEARQCVVCSEGDDSVEHVFAEMYSSEERTTVGVDGSRVQHCSQILLGEATYFPVKCSVIHRHWHTLSVIRSEGVGLQQYSGPLGQRRSVTGHVTNVVCR